MFSLRKLSVHIAWVKPLSTIFSNFRNFSRESLTKYAHSDLSNAAKKVLNNNDNNNNNNNNNNVFIIRGLNALAV